MDTLNNVKTAYKVNKMKNEMKDKAASFTKKSSSVGSKTDLEK